MWRPGAHRTLAGGAGERVPATHRAVACGRELLPFSDRELDSRSCLDYADLRIPSMCSRFQYKNDSKLTMELLDSDGENSEENRCSGLVDTLLGEGGDDIQPEVVQQLKQKPVYLGRWVITDYTIIVHDVSKG